MFLARPARKYSFKYKKTLTRELAKQVNNKNIKLVNTTNKKNRPMQYTIFCIHRPHNLHSNNYINYKAVLHKKQYDRSFSLLSKNYALNIAHQGYIRNSNSLQIHKLHKFLRRPPFVCLPVSLRTWWCSRHGEVIAGLTTGKLWSLHVWAL